MPAAAGRCSVVVGAHWGVEDEAGRVVEVVGARAEEGGELGGVAGDLDVEARGRVGEGFGGWERGGEEGGWEEEDEERLGEEC